MSAEWILAACAVASLGVGLAYHVWSDTRTREEFRQFKRKVKKWMRTMRNDNDTQP